MGKLKKILKSLVNTKFLISLVVCGVALMIYSPSGYGVFHKHKELKEVPKIETPKMGEKDMRGGPGPSAPTTSPKEKFMRRYGSGVLMTPKTRNA